MLLDHLPVNGVERLLSPENISLDAGAGQLVRQAAQNLLHHLLAVAPHGFDGTFQHFITVRIDALERQILQLAEEGVQTQPVGNRRIDFQGFACNAPTLIRAHAAQSLHVVQTIRQLDQDDANITRHR